MQYILFIVNPLVYLLHWLVRIVGPQRVLLLASSADYMANEPARKTENSAHTHTFACPTKKQKRNAN